MNIKRAMARLNPVPPPRPGAPLSERGQAGLTALLASAAADGSEAPTAPLGGEGDRTASDTGAAGRPRGLNWNRQRRVWAPVAVGAAVATLIAAAAIFAAGRSADQPAVSDPDPTTLTGEVAAVTGASQEPEARTATLVVPLPATGGAPGYAAFRMWLPSDTPTPEIGETFRFSRVSKGIYELDLTASLAVDLVFQLLPTASDEEAAWAATHASGSVGCSNPDRPGPWLSVPAGGVDVSVDAICGLRGGRPLYGFFLAANPAGPAGQVFADYRGPSEANPAAGLDSSWDHFWPTLAQTGTDRDALVAALAEDGQDPPYGDPATKPPWNTRPNADGLLGEAAQANLPADMADLTGEELRLRLEELGWLVKASDTSNTEGLPAGAWVSLDCPVAYRSNSPCQLEISDGAAPDTTP
ncbi:MAG: hypothetical protein LBO20_05490 [Bifidobacteriaceae bacterium]|jgi:hypothetical protein|nr:hypothetical protein [Bifidobacteriaceae bacterium]